MSVIQIQGPTPAKGEIFVQGSKNGVLPVMAAALLHKGVTVIENVPRIQDVYCMMGILKSLGCKIGFSGHTMMIDAKTLTSVEISREDMIKMRSSIILLGPLLARAGQAVTYFPGGCSIGKRPIDLHLYALEKLGTCFAELDGKIMAFTPCLEGGEVHFRFPSVGATENALLAAVAAEGVTVLTGCAMEPEIGELCDFLCGMGAEISGIGTSCLTVIGLQPLHDSVWRIRGDRIVAGTYLAAAIASRGDVTVVGADREQMAAELRQFELTGSTITSGRDWIRLVAGKRSVGTYIRTGPYPMFPTDLQSVMMSVLCFAATDSVVEENIFEGRFETANQLMRMGARIEICDTQAHIMGCGQLKGARVKAPDLRGGAALTVAALAAQGESFIEDYHHVMRGYENICKDLESLGADIRLNQG